MTVFLGCTSTGRVGLCFFWVFVQKLSKAQPAVVLVLKRLRRRGNGLKSHPTDWEKPGIEPAIPGFQDIGIYSDHQKVILKVITKQYKMQKCLKNLSRFKVPKMGLWKININNSTSLKVKCTSNYT